jgi:hypothetical protein
MQLTDLIPANSRNVAQIVEDIKIFWHKNLCPLRLLCDTAFLGTLD